MGDFEMFKSKDLDTCVPPISPCFGRVEDDIFKSIIQTFCSDFRIDPNPTAIRECVELDGRIAPIKSMKTQEIYVNPDVRRCKRITFGGDMISAYVDSLMKILLNILSPQLGLIEYMDVDRTHGDIMLYNGATESNPYGDFFDFHRDTPTNPDYQQFTFLICLDSKISRFDSFDTSGNTDVVMLPYHALYETYFNEDKEPYMDLNMCHHSFPQSTMVQNCLLFPSYAQHRGNAVRCAGDFKLVMKFDVNMIVRPKIPTLLKTINYTDRCKCFMCMPILYDAAIMKIIHGFEMPIVIENIILTYLAPDISRCDCEVSLSPCGCCSCSCIICIERCQKPMFCRHQEGNPYGYDDDDNMCNEYDDYDIYSEW
jgi:hypothetical protein